MPLVAIAAQTVCDAIMKMSSILLKLSVTSAIVKSIMISTQERIQFYLGTLLNNQSCVLLDDKAYSFEFLSTNTFIHRSIYHAPMANLLKKTNNTQRRFFFTYGDNIEDNSNVGFVKCRTSINDPSVILRSFSLKRHWSNYYSRPNDIPYRRKKDVVFWRGTTTGDEKDKGNRFTLVKRWFSSSPRIIDVGFSSICQRKDNYQTFLKSKCTIEEMLHHKYLISAPGNDKDTGLNWKLNSNSVVMMPQPQKCSWLMEYKLIPNYHYVLLKDDYSDLEDKYYWCQRNEMNCTQIIQNAHSFMQNFKNDRTERKIELEVVRQYFKKTSCK
jgi:hypothetical protein